MTIQTYYKKIHVTEGEEIENVITQHPLMKSHLLVLGVVLLFLPFFLMFPLFEMGQFGVAVFIALQVIALFFIIREYYMWKYNCFIITNKKIVDIDQKGLFNKVVSEVPYAKILDVAYESKGVWKSLLGVGDITVTTSIPNLSLRIRHVPDVKIRVATITELLEREDAPEKKDIHVDKDSNIKEVMNGDIETYADYSLKELIEEYTEVYSVTALKKILIEKLVSNSSRVDRDTSDGV